MAAKITHKSTASKLRVQFSNVATGLAELVKTLTVHRPRRSVGGGIVIMAEPDFYFYERSAAQKAVQLAVKREYDVAAEILKLLVRGGPDELVNELSKADARFRQWL